MKGPDRFRGCLLGLAVGDAIGTTVEFEPRGQFESLSDMVGGGPFRLEPGQWTDDTSMALCLATSLVESGAFDARDQMNRYCRWRDEGYLSSNGRCFDIGIRLLPHSDAIRKRTTHWRVRPIRSRLVTGRSCAWHPYRCSSFRMRMPSSSTLERVRAPRTLRPSV